MTKRALMALLMTAIVPNPAVAFDELRLDMGSSVSPVADGWRRVTPADRYDAQRAYGWEQPPSGAFCRDRHWPGTLPPWHSKMRDLPLDPLTRDGVESRSPVVFRIDVPKGEYVVRVWLGDYVQPARLMTVSVNGHMIANRVSAGIGGIWGQILRAAVITVRGVVPAEDGRLRLEFTSANKRNSILAVHVRRYVRPDVRLEGTDLKCVNAANDAGESICRLLNGGNPDGALGLAAELDDRRDAYLKAQLLGAVAGHIAITDPKSVERTLAQAVEILAAQSAAGDPMAVAECLDVLRTFHRAVRYMRMMRYDWAYEQTKKSSYRRYREAVMLAGQILPHEPLYWQAQLLRARVLFWQGREGSRDAREQAKPIIERLHQTFPNSRIVHIYAGQRVEPARSYPPLPADAPRWARAERNLLRRVLDVVRFWLTERQTETGEIGGGWGNDVEILRTWGRVAMALDIDWLNEGILRMADGVWNHNPDLKEHGYPIGLGDVEHAAEPISDTQPLAMALSYGEPRFVTRCLRSVSHMATRWTGVTPKGHRHFKSYNFGSDVVDPNPDAGYDVPLCARATKPGMWVAWYNRHPELIRLFREWGDAWVADAMRSDGGKPIGIFPAGVRFTDDSFPTPWHDAGYTKIDNVWYTCTMFEQLLTNWLCTGEARYLTPMHETMQMVVDQWRSPATVKPGSRAWVGKVFRSRPFLDVVGKWRLVSGDGRHDGALAKLGHIYLRHLLGGATEDYTVAQLERAATANSGNFEMLTAEVLFTDRVWLKGTDQIYALYGGGVGDLSGCPGHAVRWENAGEDLAAWVVTATSDAFRSRVYSFAPEPKEFGMQLWRLSPGRYRLSVRATDAEDRQIISFGHRGDTVPIALPARRECVVELSQVERYDWDPATLPDLAVGEHLKRSQDGKTLTCTVLNLGSVPATKVTVRLCAHGQVLAEKAIPSLPAMAAMNPTGQRVTFDVSGDAAPLAVVVDPEDRIAEITERNNRRTSNQ